MIFLRLPALNIGRAFFGNRQVRVLEHLACCSGISYTSLEGEVHVMLVSCHPPDLGSMYLVPWRMRPVGNVLKQGYSYVLRWNVKTDEVAAGETQPVKSQVVKKIPRSPTSEGNASNMASCSGLFIDEAHVQSEQIRPARYARYSHPVACPQRYEKASRDRTGARAALGELLVFCSAIP